MPIEGLVKLSVKFVRPVDGIAGWRLVGLHRRRIWNGTLRLMVLSMIDTFELGRFTLVISKPFYTYYQKSFVLLK